MNTELEENKENRLSLNPSSVIITSLSFVSALAWNSAFQNYFEKNNLLNKGGPWIYAISVTLIIIIIVFIFNKINLYFLS